MSILRKLSLFTILVLSIIGLKLIETSEFTVFQSETLLAFGFILIAAYSIGELTNLLGLTRISGYLFTGIIFGPYSNFIFQTDYLTIFSDTIINELKLLNEIAISLIALLIGSKIDLKDLRDGKKTILLIVFSKIILVAFPIFLIILILTPYFEVLKALNFSSILLLSSLIAVLMISTSSLNTIAVMTETGDQSKLSKYTLNISVVKDILIVILIGIILNGLGFKFFIDKSQVRYSILVVILQDLFLAITIGIIFGLIVIAYLKFIGKEKLVFLVPFFLIVCKLISYLNINLLLLFIIVGFIIKNFSDLSTALDEPLEKLSVPAYAISFTILGAELNLNLISLTFQIALIVFLFRILLTFLATKISTKIVEEEKEIQNNLWFGFISQSPLIFVFSISIISHPLEINETLYSLLISIGGFNLLLGPPLFNLAIKNYNRVWNKVLIEQDKKFKDKVPENIIPHRKFNVPQFEDTNLNNLIISLREKLINHLQEFENQLINKRSEEALEFYYQIVEKYIDEYQQLKNIFTKKKISGKEIKEKVLLTQQEISEWFAKISVQRKTIENQILHAEYLLQKLFEDLKDYCENAPDYVIVDQEQDKYEKETDDSFWVKSVKSYKQLDKNVRNFFGIKSVLKRKIPYVTLVKYYFEYQIALEMENVAFLLGLERLNVLRKVKKIYDDVTANLEELINLVAEHRDVESISLIAIDKLNEIHDRLKQEISSIGEEIDLSNKNISIRLNYAFANPFNQFLKSILKAGTIELNIKKFHFSRIYFETNKAKENTLETIRFWVNYLIGFLGVCERDARTFEITGKINSLINDTMINHSDIINSYIRGLISDLNSLFKNFENEISNKDLLKFDNLAKIKNIIGRYRDEIIFTLNDKGISKLTHYKKTYNIANVVNSLKDQFTSIIKNYDKEIKVLNEHDLELTKTKTEYIELKTLQFIDVIKNYFENEILQEIIKLNELISGHLSSSILELKNIENVILYYFNTAIDELNKLELNKDTDIINEEIPKVIDDTIKSSTKLLREKIKIWNRQVEKFEREIEVSLTEKIYSQITNIKDTFRKKLTDELQRAIKIKKYHILLMKVNKKINQFYLTAKGFAFSIKNKIKQIIRSLIKDAKDFQELNFEEKSISIYSHDQTVYDEKVYNSLPFVYKKLFDYTFSDIVEILVGREKENELLRQAYERTLKGLSGSTAIIGESGTGKSSLISSFLSKIQTDVNIYRYNFESTIRTEKELLKILSNILGMQYTATTNEIITKLNLEPQFNIIILEDIHKAFLRKYGGLESIKKLLLIISETSNKIFWIISISYHAWQLLNRILNIGIYFPFQIKTEVLSKEQIKEALLKRHHTSGYNLEFLPDENYKVHTHLGYSLFSQDKKEALENAFFDKLYEACEGNITSALYYWVRSIKEFKNDTIYIKPLKKLDFRFLENFEIDNLLTLSNLIQHGSLTIKEHQEIFRCSEEKSKAILNFLHTANLIHFDMNERGEKIYYINSALYKSVEIALRKLHIFD